MKRWSLPASALVLVLIACGAGLKPAPRVTAVKARVPSVRAIAARRERAAAREAARLLRRLVLPPGARRLRALPNYGGVMRRYGAGPLGEEVAVHRFWSVRKPLEAVIAFLRAHRLRGFAASGATWGSRKPHYITMGSRRPAAAPTRFLDVTSLGLPTHTLIRADVQVEWTYPRAASERVPAATREIDVRTPRVSVDVKNPAKVARIVRWFDALPVDPPGVAVACPLTLAAQITLSFRRADGTPVARAGVPDTSAGVCDPIGFTLGGRRLEPLIDHRRGESFARRLQELLGVRLVRARR
jgi:hypothetical protein